MCNKVVPESSIDHQKRQLNNDNDDNDNNNNNTTVFMMDSLSPSSDSPVSSAMDDHTTPRVKFLCSFSGSILPRPQDGKLRYVGGETRIVSVPRDVGFEDLMAKMRELFDGASVLKYQQPDEDLDALVSVVNDEDVVNMMEEYDKLGSGDGFTRLRIFLFSQPEHDASSHFDGGDERETERRYVDALNSLNDGADFRRESPVISPVDDLAEQYFNSMSLETGVHSRNYDFPLPTQPYGLHHLSIPQHHQMMSTRFGEVDSPWSPAYYSPRCHGLEPRQPAAAEFPSSPSSARFHVAFGEFSGDEIPRTNQQIPPGFDQFSDNSGWIPGDKSAFPGNLFHGPSVVEGSSICEHCRIAFQRNYDHPSMSNGIHQNPNSCMNCPPNPDSRLHQHGVYGDDHEAMSHERSWILQPQMNARVDDVRGSDYYAVDGVGMSLPHGHSNIVSANYHDQTVVGLPHIRVPSHEETGVRYGNVPFAGENLYPTHGHLTGHPLRRNIPNQGHVAQPYEGGNSMMQFNGKVNPGLPRGQWEGSPRLCVGMENQSPWSESSKVSGFEGKAVAEYAYGSASSSRLSSPMPGQENQPLVSAELVRVSPDMISVGGAVEPCREEIRLHEEKHEADTEKFEAVNVPVVLSSEAKDVDCSDGEISSLQSMNSSLSKAADENVERDEKGPSATENLNSEDKLSVLPELIASAKKAAIDGVNDVKAKVEGNVDCERNGSMNAPADTNLDSDSDSINPSTIEPTKAEAEAIDKGLQTIKNDDLEEIRELGSGTYGAVYHGKWRGSDVAIKRVKASCFAGRPFERERLIADFWKEALILSSLHHPNVVSFYGIVRDGPDGSLATVTEFMINGSLKQFLQKKDRTIDRRKRLIIAMDAAFGMEYLHGKNIVHFDLKCENLLVNMRDPQRPVCKIGDLGLSKVKQHTLVSGGVRGTLPWMAPELLSGKSNMVTEKIDVYSFGIVMWELLTGEEPYADMHCASIIGGIVNNTLRPQVPTWCDPEWKSLMEGCWAADPAQRPSFSEISQKLRNMAAAMNVK